MQRQSRSKSLERENAESSYDDQASIVDGNLATGHDACQSLIDSKRFPSCQPKEKGSHPGWIFDGVNKENRAKRIYVKHYTKCFLVDKTVNTEKIFLIDYAYFKIMKHCSVKAPKVRAGITTSSGHHQYYLFSTDIAHARRKHQDKTYYYSEKSNNELKFYAKTGVVSSTQNYLPEHNDDGEFRRPAYQYQIDRASTARLLMLAMILQITDLHDENIGFVLSRKEDQVKAKLTFIDFLSMTAKLHIHAELSLKEMLWAYYNVHEADNIVISLIELLTEDEFVNAFLELETAGLLDVCDSLGKEIDTMEGPNAKMKADFSDRIAMIKENFISMRTHINNKYGVEPESESMEDATVIQKRVNTKNKCTIL